MARQRVPVVRRVLFLVCAGAAVIFLIGLFLDWDSILVVQGIHRMRLYRRVFNGFGVAAVLAGAWAVALTLLAGRKSPRKRPPPKPARAGKAPLTAGEVRAELEAHMGRDPAYLDSVIEKALGQLDRVGRRQAKWEQIITRNGATYVEEVSLTLGRAADTICKNLGISLVNRLIIWDIQEARSGSNPELYAEHREYLQAILDANDRQLKLCSQLIEEATCYIDEKRQGLESSETHLTIMHDVIHSLRNVSEEFSL